MCFSVNTPAIAARKITIIASLTLRSVYDERSYRLTK